MNQPEEPGAIIAAFDIGSNSVKMTIGRCDADGSVREFAWRSATTRLSSGIDRTGQLDPERVEMTIEALEEMTLQARAVGATRLIAVATEATRAASNGQEFLERVRATTGIEIEAITGDREAELTYLGLSPAIPRDGTIAIADIGGGSTELIVAIDGELQQSKSLPIGSGRLTDEFQPSDPPSMVDLLHIQSGVRQRVEQFGLPGHVDRLIIVGGTGEFLGRLLPREYPVPLSFVQNALHIVSKLSAAELSRKIDVNVERARVLPAGIATVLALAELSSPELIFGAPSGIRTGLLQLACQEVQ